MTQNHSIAAMPIWRYVDDSGSEDQDLVANEIVLSQGQKFHLESGTAFVDRVEMPVFEYPMTLMTDCQGLSL